MFPGMGLMVPKAELESIDKFLKRMPAFVGQKEKLSVLMTSYNGIIGVAEGEGRGLLGGRLDVMVHVGDHGGLMAASGGPDNAKKVQAGIERRTRLDGRLFNLAFVYVGLNVFDSTLQFAARLKRHGKAQRVVVLTCDCNLTEKRKAIDPLLASEDLAAAVWTKECGGHRDMRAILDRLEACFP